MAAEYTMPSDDEVAQGNGHVRHGDEGIELDVSGEDADDDGDDHEDGGSDDAGPEEEAEDDDDGDASASDSNSNYSSASEDGLPPIHAYGHVYHGSGRMVTPNDRCENERQGYQHELFTLCLGGALTFTKLPLEKLTAETPHFHILDVGSGGGHWAMEMALNNPLVDVLGIELSCANLPKEVPPNLTFEIADAAEDWPPRLYDFIHLRNLVGGGIRDWHRLIVQAFDHLKPGGQLEFTEVTPLFFGVDPDPLAEDSDTPSGGEEATTTEKPRAAVGAATIEYGAVFAEIAAAQGIDFDPTPKVRPWLMQLGAENVRERSDWLPVRNWARDPLTRKKGEILNKMLDTGGFYYTIRLVEWMANKACLLGCDHWTLRMFGLAGWEEEKIRDLLARVMLEYQDPLLRSCIKVYVWFPIQVVSNTTLWML